MGHTASYRVSCYMRINVFVYSVSFFLYIKYMIVFKLSKVKLFARVVKIFLWDMREQCFTLKIRIGITLQPRPVKLDFG